MTAAERRIDRLAKDHAAIDGLRLAFRGLRKAALPVLEALQDGQMPTEAAIAELWAYAKVDTYCCF